MSWPNFKRSEFACQCGCGTNKIQDELIDFIQDLRTRCGFPFPITSGYRCPKHPIEARKSAPGAHAKGLAADIGVRGEQANAVIFEALRDTRLGGWGLNQKGSGRFVHLDIGKRRGPWTY